METFLKLSMVGLLAQTYLIHGRIRQLSSIIELKLKLSKNISNFTALLSLFPGFRGGRSGSRKATPNTKSRFSHAFTQTVEATNLGSEHAHLFFAMHDGFESHDWRVMETFLKLSMVGLLAQTYLIHGRIRQLSSIIELKLKLSKNISNFTALLSLFHASPGPRKRPGARL